MAFGCLGYRRALGGRANGTSSTLRSFSCLLLREHHLRYIAKAEAPIRPVVQRPNLRQPFQRSYFSTTASTNFPKMITVSILGPPNAGKSTLFNRLLDREINKAYRLTSEKKGKGRGRKKQNKAIGAIVSDLPGTTRDRRECVGRIGGIYFRLYDTAGVDGSRLQDHGQIMKDMVAQSYKAAEQSDLVLLMFDGRLGITSDLLEIAKWLRKSSTPRVQILANKMEGRTGIYDDDSWSNVDEVSRLGFGEAIPISAIHGDGMADLALLIKDISEGGQRTETQEPPNEEAVKPLQLAVLGRQNVGKSTLVNALLGENRVLTGSTPGLTRDAISIQWSWNNRPIQLVDTAGIRRKAKRDNNDDIEDMAVQDAMRAMKIADVAVLVLDTDSRRLMRQELAIADEIIKEGRALVIAANKIDLLIEENFPAQELEYQIRERLEERFPFLRKTPIVPMSSLTGESVADLLPVVFQTRDRWAQKITTGQLNQWMREVLVGKQAPLVSNRPLRIKYVTQKKGRPPTFLLFCNADKIPESYLRYLTQHFQDSFEMFGMEVRLLVRKSAVDNPFEKKKRRGRYIGGKEARKKRLYQKLAENQRRG